MDLTAWLEQEPAQRLRGRDLLADSDLKPDEVAWLLDFALAMKAAGPNGARHLLPGRTVALLFEKPSTRTRVSFEVAVWQLGGIGLSLNVGDLQMSRGETIEDTGRVLSRYVQGIVMRTFGQSRLQALAEAASVPVVNALSDRFHPCQIMADLLTLKERFGRLAGLHLVYLGDGNNVAHSLAVGGALSGMRVTVCTPPGFEPDADVIGNARAIAEGTGGDVRLATVPADCVQDADALYTDVWVSMGQEGGPDRHAAFAPYQINGSLLAQAPDHAIVLHCLPAHRGEEITDEVLDGPRSAVWDQAENRLHVQKAILAALLAS